jgi:hypothetical protein
MMTYRGKPLCVKKRGLCLCVTAIWQKGDCVSIRTILYILDHIFFNFAIAIRTYFQKVGDPRDIVPSIAVGFTINHIMAVFLPAIGGLLWIIDYRIPFFGGAAMALISLIAVQRIDISIRKKNRTILIITLMLFRRTPKETR